MQLALLGVGERISQGAAPPRALNNNDFYRNGFRDFFRLSVSRFLFKHCSDIFSRLFAALFFSKRFSDIFPRLSLARFSSNFPCS